MPSPELRRVTDRASFAALREGRRTRRGALSVTYLPPSDAAAPAEVRVAFQVGKASGGAVVRNRIRRRLRAGLRQLLRQGALPVGTYLLGGRASLATQPWTALLEDLTAAVATATGPGGTGAAR